MNPLKILIVEDEDSSAMLMRYGINQDFPDATFTVVKKLSDALDVIHAESPPDLVMLDLTLLDADRDVTLSHVDEIKRICPVAIISGHPVDAIRAASGDDVPICDKMTLSQPGILSQVVKFTLEAWCGPSKIEQTICRARESLSTPIPPHGAR